MSTLLSEGKLSEKTFELVFQGAGTGDEFKEVLEELGISNLVKFLAPVPFLHALSNMMNCNALLLIQDERFNKQIPGKLYEYLRTQKKLLVKSPIGSATECLASRYDGVYSCYSENEAKTALYELIKQANYSFERNLQEHSRECKAEQLHNTLKTLCAIENENT